MKTTFLVIALFLSLGASAQNRDSTSEASVHKVEMVVSNSKELKINGKDFILLNLSPVHASDLKINKSCLNPNNKFTSFKNDALFAANIAAAGFASYSLLKTDYDKTKHFMAGYIISSTTSGALQLILPKEMKHRKLIAAAIGFGNSILIGVGKEVYDAKHPLNHTADKYDAIATLAGGAQWEQSPLA
jgi:hypothetical protein